MKVVMTQTASESLWPVYLYHSGYSQDYAEAFQYEIDRFILEHLSSSPLLGHLYHEPRGIQRLIFQKRYNTTTLSETAPPSFSPYLMDRWGSIRTSKSTGSTPVTLSDKYIVSI
jgi:hypothetical protein